MAMKPPNKVLETVYCFLIILISVAYSDSTSRLWNIRNYTFEFEDVTRVAESPFLSETNIIDLDLSSQYCGQLTQFGRSCDYSKTNKTIRLPAGLKFSQGMITFMELKIQDATAVHIYPTCISWLQITRAHYVKTFPSDQQLSETQEDCRTWLRIYDSTVDEISDGVLDVTLMHSKVTKLNLKNQRDIMSINSTIYHIEWLDWTGYKGHIANTSINIITRMLANSNLMIIHSIIGVLEQGSLTLNNSENQFFSTKFNVIRSNGLTFLGLSNELTNVTIDKLNKYGITTGLNAGLTLTNVHILKADPPAFSFYSATSIKIENVTIEGEPLKMNSKWVETGDTVGTKEISNTSEICEWAEGTFVCNLKNFDFHLFLDFKDFTTRLSIKNLTIKNAFISELSNFPCNVSLTLIHCNITGYIRSEEVKKSDDECTSELKARRCDIGYINSWNLNTLDFENVRVNSLNSSQVSYIHFKYSEIDEVRSLITRDDSRVRIQHSKLGKINNAVFNEPIKLEHSKISSITGRLELNHLGESSLFLNSSIDYIGYRGLHLLSGCLQLNDTKMKHMQEQSIFLEKDTLLNINNSFSFPRLGLKSISVLKYEQASINIPSLPIKTTDWMFYIREPQKEEIDASFERFHLNNLTVSSNSYCEGSGSELQTVKCNFKNMEVEVDITYAVQLTLQNISYLTLHPSCSSLIYLNDVLDGTILSSDSKLCKTSIHIHNSGIHEMRGGTKDFLANSSLIENFIPTDEPFENILILNSNISSIEGIEYSGLHEVSHSTIKNLHMMSGLHGSELWIFDSQIKLIDVFGVTIEKGSVFNSMIEHIMFYGVTVNGELNVTNTTMRNIDLESIIIEGVLNLQNVIIENGTIDSFLLAGGMMKCQNVTVGGQKILSKDIIFNEGTTIAKTEHNENSVQLRTEKVTIKKENPTMKPSAIEPPIDHMTIPKESELQTKSNFEKHVVTANSKIQNPSPSSYSWLFGVLGFLIGAALMFGFAYMYVLCRPDIQNLTPTVRWKVTDDEHDLIPSDDEVAGERI